MTDFLKGQNPLESQMAYNSTMNKRIVLSCMIIASVFIVFQLNGRNFKLNSSGLPNFTTNSSNEKTHTTISGVIGREAKTHTKSQRSETTTTGKGGRFNGHIGQVIDTNGELNDETLESFGLNTAQIDSLKRDFSQISKQISDEISEYFMQHCEEEMTADGSYVYVLHGSKDFAESMQTKMETSLSKSINLGLSGSQLAGLITEQLKGKALLSFGAYDMIGDSYRGINSVGKWEDGILINSSGPGMIDYYRKNGWPSGNDIHQSTGKAIFHTMHKTR